MRKDLPFRDKFDDVGAALLQTVSPRRWARANVSERERLLRALHGRLGQLWGVSEVPLVFADLGDDIGRYDHQTDELYLDKTLVDSHDITEPLSTLVHEMRHAVQQRAISDPAQHPLGAAGTDEAARWQAAELTYDDDALDLTAYAYNGLETDAYGVERAVLMAYWRHAYVRFGRRLWRAR